MQLAAATAANGTNRPIRGEMCCKEKTRKRKAEINKTRLQWKPERIGKTLDL